VSFDLQGANQVPGVLGVFTWQEMANAIRPVKHLMVGEYANSSALPLGSPEIHDPGQMIAVVAAESSAAEEAAFLLDVHYSPLLSSITTQLSCSARLAPGRATGSRSMNQRDTSAPLSTGWLRN
jgi:CO/xanthine dehydrogenase Mo-binding subunit